MPVNEFDNMRGDSYYMLAGALADAWDAFGAVARWTESIFSFASDSAGADADGDVPPGYSDIYPLLVERGLTKYTLDVPDGFVLTDIYFDIRDATGDAKFTLLYTMDDNYISYTIDRNSSTPTTVYEKDDNPVEGFEADGVTHHIFTNLDSATAVWLIEDLEFSISSSLGASAVADMVRSFYPAAIGE